MPAIQLPGGHTATLRDKLVSERHHRVLEAASVAADAALRKVQAAAEGSEEITTDRLGLTRQEAAALLELQDAAICAFVERWSLDRPLPTMTDVCDLDREVYAALAEATKPLVATLQPPTDFSAGPGKTRPTIASSSWSNPSSDEAASPWTETPGNVGESTAIASSTPA